MRMLGKVCIPILFIGIVLIVISDYSHFISPIIGMIILFTVLCLILIDIRLNGEMENKFFLKFLKRFYTYTPINGTFIERDNFIMELKKNKIKFFYIGFHDNNKSQNNIYFGHTFDFYIYKKHIAWLVAKEL